MTLLNMRGIVKITKTMKTKEVKLAEEGTIMAKFQKERTDAISEMFDNKYEDGIYPTSKFFIRLDNALLKALSQQKREMVVNVSSLRQWLNEDRITDSKKMVTNKEILIWFKQNLNK